MILKLHSSPQILDFINNKQASQNLSQMVVKVLRMKIEIFLQSLEAGLKFLELQQRVRVVQIGETKICLRINKLVSMKLKLKGKS